MSDDQKPSSRSARSTRSTRSTDKKTAANSKSNLHLRVILIAAAIAIVAVTIAGFTIMSSVGSITTPDPEDSEITMEVNDVMAPEAYLFDECAKTVYVTQDAELHSEPDDECDDVLAVEKLSELTLTGTNEHKYWRVSYDGFTWYIDSELITEDKAALEEQKREEKVQEAQAQVIEQNAADVIVLGDSRTVGMEMSVSSNAKFVCKGSMGYSWMMSTAIPQAEAAMDDNTVCIFNFGVNDLGNANKYVQALNEFAARHPNNVVCFMSVNPVDEAKEAQYGYSVKNSSIANFNSTLQNGLSGVRYIDSYNYMMNNGFSTFDGLHYTANTYVNLYNYMISNIA